VWRLLETLSMEYLTLLLLLALAVHLLNRRAQGVRTALLAGHLRPLQIEQHMQRITEGSMRALAETDPQRQAQIWAGLGDAEQRLAQDFRRLADAFAQVPAPQARVLKLALPGLDQLSPRTTFDMRRALRIHAEGIERAVANADALPPRDRAFRLMGEMFLMQHTCHWFCRSRMIANARMLAQHQTPYTRALEAVGAQTRADYLALVQG
jgi:hypothetical protein